MDDPRKLLVMIQDLTELAYQRGEELLIAAGSGKKFIRNTITFGLERIRVTFIDGEIKGYEQELGVGLAIDRLEMCEIEWEGFLAKVRQDKNGNKI